MNRLRRIACGHHSHTQWCEALQWVIGLTLFTVLGIALFITWLTDRAAPPSVFVVLWLWVTLEVLPIRFPKEMFGRFMMMVAILALQLTD